MGKLNEIVKLASKFLPARKGVKECLNYIHFEIQGNTLLRVTATDLTTMFIGNFFSDNLIVSEYNEILINKKSLPLFSICNDNDIIHINTENLDNIFLQIGNIKIPGFLPNSYPKIDLDIFTKEINVGENFIEKLQFAKHAIGKDSGTGFICANFKSGYITATNREIMNITIKDFPENYIDKILITEKSTKAFDYLKKDIRTIKISNLANVHFALFNMTLPDCYSILTLEHPDTNILQYLDVAHDSKYCTDMIQFDKKEILKILKKFKKIQKAYFDEPAIIELTFGETSLKLTHLPSGLINFLKTEVNGNVPIETIKFQLKILLTSINSQPDNIIKLRLQKRRDLCQVIDGESGYQSFIMPYNLVNVNGCE